MRCYKCKNEKDTSEFYRDRTRPNGFAALCKTCTKERDRDRQDYLKKYRREYGRKYKQKAKDFIWSLKTPCVNCGESDPACIDFHHRNPEEKEFHVGRMQGKSEAKIIKEVEKCVCLCANCHRKLHAGREIAIE
jgi:predicted HNH restriction endonuclease